MEAKAKAKARMLSILIPEQVLFATCYSILDGSRPKKRFGLILAPPDYIRLNLKSTMPGFISHKRKQKSLRMILRSWETETRTLE